VGARSGGNPRLARGIALEQLAHERVGGWRWDHGDRLSEASLGTAVRTPLRIQSLQGHAGARAAVKYVGHYPADGRAVAAG
jgi:hypothetical protein